MSTRPVSVPSEWRWLIGTVADLIRPLRRARKHRCKDRQDSQDPQLARPSRRSEPRHGAQSLPKGEVLSDSLIASARGRIFFFLSLGRKDTEILDRDGTTPFLHFPEELQPLRKLG